MEKNKIKFGFGVDQDICEPDTFDTVEELIEYAQYSWDNKDGNPFDEDVDYSGVIFVGTVRNYSPYDFAPSLDSICDEMTDSFYCINAIDDDEEVKVRNIEEAEKAWKDFVDKYFEIPCNYVGNWTVGEYDLVKHKWVEKYKDFDKYVKE